MVPANYSMAMHMQAGFERAHERGLAGVGGGATTRLDDGVRRFKRTSGGRELTHGLRSW